MQTVAKRKVDLCNVKPEDADMLVKRLRARAERFAQLVQLKGVAAPPALILDKERVLVMDAVSDLLAIRGSGEEQK